jgi:hypothetical protein
MRAAATLSFVILPASFECASSPVLGLVLSTGVPVTKRAMIAPAPIASRILARARLTCRATR